jgi:hypothetical protein
VHSPTRAHRKIDPVNVAAAYVLTMGAIVVVCVAAAVVLALHGGGTAGVGVAAAIGGAALGALAGRAGGAR